MNLNHLAIFHAVAEEKSVSRGALRLCISQPAVSKQLSDFEKSLGTPLFDRLPRGMRLTQAGELLERHARRLFAVESEAIRELDALRGLDRGRLHIGASLTTGVYLLPKLLTQFRKRYPTIEIQMEVANTEVIQERLIEGSLDLGFTEGLLEDANLEAFVFAHDEIVAIAPAQYAAFRDTPVGRPVALARFCREPMILREIGSGTRAVLDIALSEHGAPPRTVAMTLSSTEAIKQAVMLGAGIAFVSRLTIAAELAAGMLDEIPIKGLTIRRPLHCIKVRGRHDSQTVRAFLALVNQQKAPI